MEDFTAIVARHQQMVFRVLVRISGRADVEDLAQDVFLRLFRSLSGFRSASSLTTYLYRIAVNVANDALRERIEQRRGVSLDDQRAAVAGRLGRMPPDYAASLDRCRARAALVEANKLLSPAERAVITLHFQEERRYEEIAAILGLPVGTVKTHLHRGREKLKTAIQERLAICRTAQ